MERNEEDVVMLYFVEFIEPRVQSTHNSIDKSDSS